MRNRLLLSISGILSTVALSLTALLPVQAAVQSSIEGGDIYRVRNITKNTGFSDPASADKCDQLQYRVLLHNPGPDAVLTGVVVKAVLPAAASTQNVSTVTATADNGNPASVSDTATVNISTAQKITYVPGSTQLLNAQGGVISTIADINTGTGTNIGSIGISVNERRFVQFKANIDCPPPPCTPPNPQCTPPCTPPNPDCTPPPCTPPNPKCTPPVESKGVCKMLDLVVTNRDKREVKATVTGEVTNATIVGYKIDFGDGFVSTLQSETHQYAKDGTYVVRGQVQIKLADNTVVNRDANDCVKQVTFKADVPPEIVTPPVVPPQQPPAVLPATGPVSVGLVASTVGAISSLSYYLVSAGRRKLFGL